MTGHVIDALMFSSLALIVAVLAHMAVSAYRRRRREESMEAILHGLVDGFGEPWRPCECGAFALSSDGIEPIDEKGVLHSVSRCQPEREAI